MSQIVVVVVVVVVHELVVGGGFGRLGNREGWFWVVFGSVGT